LTQFPGARMRSFHLLSTGLCVFSFFFFFFSFHLRLPRNLTSPFSGFEITVSHPPPTSSITPFTPSGPVRIFILPPPPRVPFHVFLTRTKSALFFWHRFFSCFLFFPGWSLRHFWKTTRFACGCPVAALFTKPSGT